MESKQFIFKPHEYRTWSPDTHTLGLNVQTHTSTHAHSAPMEKYTPTTAGIWHSVSLSRLPPCPSFIALNTHTHTHTHTHSYGLMFICLCFLCSLSLDNVLNCNHFNHSLISTLQMIFSTQNGVLCMFLKFTCLSAGEPRSYWGGICQFLRRVLAPVAHPDIWRQQTTFVIINSQQPHTLCPQFRYNWLSTLSEARGIGKVVSWENRAVQKSFAQRGARTHDPEIKSLMLYRLS